MSPAEIAPPTWMPGGLWPARSRAEVRFCLGERREVERTTLRLFGRLLQRWEYAGLAGAPDDARVELGTWQDELSLELGDSREGQYRGYLYVRRRGPALVMFNAGLQILHSGMQRWGWGLRVFHRQLENATVLGIARIEAVAGRRDDENGYYTWPRFGFEGRLPRKIQARLPPSLACARTVLDLMESDHGRLWWQRHGCTIRVVFDLADGSRSREVFRRYVDEKLQGVGADVVAAGGWDRRAPTQSVGR